MNILIPQVQCNSCQAVIPASGQNGAVRLPGTAIDFCAECSEKAVSFVAATFKMPTGTGEMAQRVKLANGRTVLLPKAAELPPGATVVGSPAAPAAASA
jgi:hypothetical protein